MIRMKNNMDWKNLQWAICCFSILGTIACSSEGKKTAFEESDKNDTVAVPVFQLKKQKLSSSIQIPGELIAFQRVDLYAKVNSFVKKLYADVGTQVQKGQLLATLEAPELNSELSVAESKLKSAEAIFIANKANYDRLHETSKTPGTVSQNDIDQALAKKNSAEADWEAAKSSYHVIIDTKNYLEIRAPFEGVVSSRNVNAGAYVGPSGKGSEFPLFTVEEQTKLRLVLSVPEAYTGNLSKQQTIHFSVKAFPATLFEARIARMAGALDTKLRSERIEMDVSNPGKKLLPGMVAEANIPLSSNDSAFLVPKTAVVNSTERLFVIRIKDGKAEWIDVKKGREDGRSVEIYGTLLSGDLLAVMGSEEIRNGAIIPKTTNVNH